MSARPNSPLLLGLGLPLLASLVLPVSCNQVLGIQELEADADSGGDGDGDAPTTLTAADFCNPTESVPLREFDDAFLDVETRGITNDFNDLSSCGISRSLRETDLFFKVELERNERYHFHVRASEEQNIVLYLLSACDERRCVGAIDECPVGVDEHFSFVPSSSGEYFLGIGGISDGPTEAPVKFLATKVECGDGVLQHSEVCDPALDPTGEACDDRCRAVLAPGASEVEPNGDRYGANVLSFAPGTSGRVRGSLGGPCDTDFFVVDVPAGGALRARMLNEAGRACSSAAPSVLRLFNSQMVLLSEAEGRDGSCPTLSEAETSDLAAGEYYVTLRTREATAPFGYQLELEVVEAAP